MHLTVTLRPKFSEVEKLLKKMERLVLRFRKTTPARLTPQRAIFLNR